MKKIILLLGIVLLNINLSAQYHVNKSWKDVSGNLSNVYKGASIRNLHDGIITMQPIVSNNSGINIQIKSFEGNGTLMWQASYDTMNHNQVGISMVETSDYNVYVTGYSEDNLGKKSLIILKFDPSGILTNTYYEAASSTHQYIGTQIKEDGQGHIYVLVNDIISPTNTDIKLIKLDADLTHQWASNYDFSGSFDIGASLSIEANSNIINIAGTSVDALPNYEMLVLRYLDDGTLYQSHRESSFAIGNDKLNDFKIDLSGAKIICGEANGNLKVIKYNDTLLKLWEYDYDGYGFSDQALCMSTNTDNQIAIGGYITLPNNKTQAILTLLDSNGASNFTLKFREKESKITDVKFINDGILAVGTFRDFNNFKNSFFTILGGDGETKMYHCLDKDTFDKELLKIVDGGFNDLYLYTTGYHDTTNQFRVQRFEYSNPNAEIVTSGNKQLYVDRQLVVKFQPSALNKNWFMQNPNHEVYQDYTSLKNVVSIDCYNRLTNIFRNYMDTLREDVTCFRVFKNFTPLDTLIKTKQNNLVPLRDFWTTLILYFPVNTNINDIMDSLNNNHLDIEHSSLNSFISMHSPPFNDPYYYQQLALHPFPAGIWAPCPYTKADVNYEQAIAVMPDAGKRTTHVGIYDAGLDWHHEEFLKDNDITTGVIPSWPYTYQVDSNCTKITGFDHHKNQSILMYPGNDNNGGGQFTCYGHGTQVASIIGANNNNGRGVSSFVGGTYEQVGNGRHLGASLHAYKITNGGATLSIPMSYLTKAIVERCVLPFNFPSIATYPYDSLDIINCSWGVSDTLDGAPAFYTAQQRRQLGLDNIKILADAFHQINRAGVTAVASRGNKDGPSLSKHPKYPACLPDDWVINVSASNNIGCLIDSINTYCNINAFPNPWTSMYGLNVDVVAPGFKDDAIGEGIQAAEGACNTSLGWQDTTVTQIYTLFAGTSAAAPHVTGLGALMQSYHNQPGFSPNNLYPEDVEALIQLGAKDDSCHIGKDEFIGHGKMDAGKTMLYLEKPYYRIFHNDADAVQGAELNGTSYLDTVNLLITYKENSISSSPQTLFPNKYLVISSVQIAQIDIPLNIGEKIVSVWPVSSNSTLYARPDSSNWLFPREQIYIDSVVDKTVYLHSHYLSVHDSNGNNVKYLPLNLDERWQISALIKDTTLPNSTTSINEVKPMLLYNVIPNPSNGNFNLKYQTTLSDPLNLTITNIAGAVVFKNEYKNQQSGNIPVNLTLNPGIYFVRLDIGSKFELQKLMIY